MCTVSFAISALTHVTQLYSVMMLILIENLCFRKYMPFCQQILHLRTFCGQDLHTFSANYFELKSRICQLFCLSNVCSQLVILTCLANAPQQVQQIKYFLFEQMDKQGREIVQKKISSEE